MQKETEPIDSNLLKGNMGTLVLAVLKDGPAHGYAIVHEVRKRTEDALHFRQGTLYPMLHDLEGKGFVASEWEIIPGEAGGGEKTRRVYSLTESGRAELSRRLRAWQRFAAAVEKVTGSAQELTFRRMILRFF